MSNASALLQALTRKEFTELVRHHRSLLRPAAAAAYLDVSVRTLEVWRATGKGPVFKKSKNGTIRYHIDALDAWLRYDDAVEVL